MCSAERAVKISR